MLRAEDLRLNSSDADRLSRKLEAMELPAVLRQTLTPLIEAMKTLDEQIKITDKELERLAADNETVKRLQTVPGVGVVTAASFAAVIDNVERFETAKQVRMYLGLVPGKTAPAKGGKRAGFFKRQTRADVFEQHLARRLNGNVRVFKSFFVFFDGGQTDDD
ncbi:MAG: transposase [Pyrinomonadaceae bacterium]